MTKQARHGAEREQWNQIKSCSSAPRSTMATRNHVRSGDSHAVRLRDRIECRTRLFQCAHFVFFLMTLSVNERCIKFYLAP